jgi:prophage regulatory protein
MKSKKQIILIKYTEVQRRTGLSRSTIYNTDRLSKVTLPRPVHLGGTSLRWVESELDAWIHKAIKKRDKEA